MRAVRRPAATVVVLLAIIVGAGIALATSGDAPKTTSPGRTDSPHPVATTATAPRPAARPDDPQRTRLVSGPFLFRLIGTRGPTATDGSPQARYTLLFRLSRGMEAVRSGPFYGAFEIAGGGLDPYAIGRSGAHCFAGVVYGAGFEDPEPARRLDRLALGTRVRVTIKPLTPTANGESTQIPRGYVRHPRLRVSRVSGHVEYKLTSPTAQRTIRSMGCD